MAMMSSDEIVATAPQKIATIRAAAEGAGRDPATIGFQVRISEPNDLDRLGSRLNAVRAAGFTGVTVNMSMLEASGVHGVDALVDMLGRIIERIHREVSVTSM